MKKIIFLLFGFLIILLVSCEDFLKEIPYNIVVSDKVVAGKITMSTNKAEPGSIISVTAVPSISGHKVVRLYYYPTSFPNDETKEVDIDLVFTMPAKNITIMCIFGADNN
ncbi:MAG: hypothetical protein ACRC5H_10755 [Treponemataceae bacterium]